MEHRSTPEIERMRKAAEAVRAVLYSNDTADEVWYGPVANPAAELLRAFDGFFEMWSKAEAGWDAVATEWSTQYAALAEALGVEYHGEPSEIPKVVDQAKKLRTLAIRVAFASEALKEAERKAFPLMTVHGPPAAEVDTTNRGAVRTFPILDDARVKKGAIEIPFELVLRHEAQAKENHDQTVERLAERGGLSYIELFAVLHSQPLNLLARWSSHHREAARRFVEIRVAEFISAATGRSPHRERALEQVARLRACLDSLERDLVANPSPPGYEAAQAITQGAVSLAMAMARIDCEER